MACSVGRIAAASLLKVGKSQWTAVRHNHPRLGVCMMTPPRERMSTLQLLTHCAIVVFGWTAIPIWVMYHMDYYKDPKGLKKDAAAGAIWFYYARLPFTLSTSTQANSHLKARFLKFMPFFDAVIVSLAACKLGLIANGSQLAHPVVAFAWYVKIISLKRFQRSCKVDEAGAFALV